jgi:hypothetical protein
LQVLISSVEHLAVFFCKLHFNFIEEINFAWSRKSFLIPSHFYGKGSFQNFKEALPFTLNMVTTFSHSVQACTHAPGGEGVALLNKDVDLDCNCNNLSHLK